VNDPEGEREKSGKIGFFEIQRRPSPDPPTKLTTGPIGDAGAQILRHKENHRRQALTSRPLVGENPSQCNIDRHPAPDGRCSRANQDGGWMARSEAEMMFQVSSNESFFPQADSHFVAPETRTNQLSFCSPLVGFSPSDSIPAEIAARC
jgi:hypothetical protein